MQEREKRHNAGGQAADFPEPEGYIKHHQDTGNRNRRQALEEELPTHSGFDGVRFAVLEVVVREFLLERLGKLCLLFDADGFVPRELYRNDIALARVGVLVPGNQVFTDCKGYSLSRFVLKQACQLCLVNRAVIAVFYDCAARKLDVELCSKYKIADNADDENCNRDAEENLLMSDKV